MSMKKDWKDQLTDIKSILDIENTAKKENNKKIIKIERSGIRATKLTLPKKQTATTETNDIKAEQTFCQAQTPETLAHPHGITHKPRFASLIEPPAPPPKPVEKKNWWAPIVAAAVAKNAASHEASSAKPTPPEQQKHNPQTIIPQIPPPPFKPRIQQQILPEMPAWGEIGKSLQHPAYQGSGAIMPVRIGIDFGTAFTKVAIRAGVDLLLIEWTDVTGDNSDTGRHVMPGLIVRLPDGEYRWQRLHHADVRSNLKLPLIEGTASNPCPTATLAYLALVIRYARAFLYRDKNIGDKLASRTLLWELNIGCPTEPHENPAIVNKFRHIARVAWMLAEDELLREKDIISVWNLTDGGEADIAIETGLEKEPGVIPEFVAQIAAYLKSSQVKEFLHVLIDIGTATLDVATFNIVLQKDPTIPIRIPIFFSAVSALGTHYLRHNRYQQLGLPLEWDDATPVECSEIFGQKNQKAPNEVVKADNTFIQQVCKCIESIIERTRTNRRGSPQNIAWREGIPLFITGGGANCDLYYQAIEKVKKEITTRVHQSVEQRNFRFIETNPAEINGQQFSDSGRLGVAIGLTEDVEDLADIAPHCAVDSVSHSTATFIDHSERYGS